MATNYKNFKEKLSEYLAANPNTTKAQIADIKKKYRSEYTRMIKLAGASDNNLKLLATMNTAETLLPRKARLDDETKKALFEGTLEEFFTRADAIHSAIEMADFIQEALEEDESQQTEAFEVAQDMASSALDHEYSSEPYDTGKSDAEFTIDMWWSHILDGVPSFEEPHQRLDLTIITQVNRWKEATINMIGPKNFVDLIQNKMGYDFDANHGDLDWESFFTQLYEEVPGETAQRIDTWLQKATDEALNYLSEDEDMGDYDEITWDIRQELENFADLNTSWDVL